MTEMMEGCVLGAESPPEECPWGCGKAPHPFASKKPHDEEIKSKPSALGDLPLAGQGEGRWGRARHHIIPAIQCFAKVRRLARMALSVGYDINDSKNGIGLPTIKNPYTHNGVVQNFGDFSKDVKKAIAFWVMDQIHKQWHVGNHAYDLTKKETEPGSMSDEGEIDHLPYDQEVIRRLVKEMLQWDEAKLCQDDDDMSEEAKKAMDRISDEIRGKLDDFQYCKSKPYYVSLVSKQWESREKERLAGG